MICRTKWLVVSLCKLRVAVLVFGWRKKEPLLDSDSSSRSEFPSISALLDILERVIGFLSLGEASTIFMKFYWIFLLMSFSSLSGEAKRMSFGESSDG